MQHYALAAGIAHPRQPLEFPALRSRRTQQDIHFVAPGWPIGRFKIFGVVAYPELPQQLLVKVKARANSLR